MLLFADALADCPKSIRLILFHQMMLQKPRIALSNLHDDLTNFKGSLGSCFPQQFVDIFEVKTRKRCN
jgi:hypothetical protein